jgi:hypothetical protein
MKLKFLFLTVIITLFSGCKSVPAPEEVEEIAEPEEIEIILVDEETNSLSQDEIDIIDEVINYIVVNELRLRKEDLQVCIYDTFSVFKSRYTDSYENDLINSENYIKNNLITDENIISSFIRRNMRRRTVERDAEFRTDFFWQGEPYQKDYLRMVFSNIGFNENNTEALIYVYVDLPTWKFAEYVYLRKINGNWRYNKSVSSR